MSGTGSGHLFISRGCVNDCVFCAVTDQRRTRPRSNRSETTGFIDRCAEGGIENLVFSGFGEPTLDPDFDAYLRHASSRGFESLTLFTNGFRLTRGRAERWREAGLSHVLVSLHGDESTHDENVGRRGSYVEAIDAIRIYTELQLRVSVNTCLTRLNLERIPKVRAALAPFDVTTHTLSFPEWSGNALRHQHLMPDYGEVASRADDLLPWDYPIGVFDNIPYCVVRKPTVELRQGRDSAQLHRPGETDTAADTNNRFHPECGRRDCPLRAFCSGFDREYVRARGWDPVGQFVHGFTTAHADRTRSAPRGSPDEPSSPPGAITVIVKPTERCNAACTYCSSFTGADSPDMSPALVDRLYDELSIYSRVAGLDRLTLLWHGGEPLCMGRDFYEAVWPRPLPHSETRLQHLLQTNLLGFDDGWIDLVQTHRVGVSTSVDPLSNARVMKNGENQFGRWFERFRLLCDRGVRVGIVFTTTAEHLDRPDALYAFFRNLQRFSATPLGVKIGPVYPFGRAAADDDATMVPSVEGYGRFLVSLWEHWDADGRPFPLQPFQDWGNPGTSPCETSGRCHQTFLGVDGAGNVAPCGRYLDLHVTYGNLWRQDLLSIVDSPLRGTLRDRQAALREGACRDCHVWDACHGGCPATVMAGGGDSTDRSPFCRAYQYTLDRCRGPEPALSH